jgi:adenylate cyclase class IV
MAQELKLRITDPQAIETKLQSLGATFVDETNFTDTYFNQPEGEVFKIVDTKNGYFLQSLKAVDGKFTLIKNQPIENADAVKTEMGNEYGIKCVLEGKRKNYSLDNITITLNLINQRGAFLIITAENPTQDFVTQKLGITTPQYITVSFDQLPLTSFTIPT